MKHQKKFRWTMNVLDQHVKTDRVICRRGTDIGDGSGLNSTPHQEWKLHGGVQAAVSARKLAASLWRLAATTKEKSGLLDRLRIESLSSMPIPDIELESVTKWSYWHLKPSVGDQHFPGKLKFSLIKNRKPKKISVASAKNVEFLKAHKRIKELEPRKLDEERVRSEHQNSCTKIKHLKNDIRRETKVFKKMIFLNSKLVNDIGEAKLVAKKFKRRFGKEKKAREFLEDLCSNLAKEIEEKKGELGAMKERCERIEKEVEEERKMMHLAEVWREERARMKLVDAKLILEDKYCQMNSLIAEMETFLRSSNLSSCCDHENIESHKSASSEISSVSIKERMKKGSSSCNTPIDIKGSGRVSSGSISSVISQDDVTVDAECRETRNPHIVRAMKGGIEWPRRVQRQGSGAEVLEAKLESQKMILRNVLKHKS